MKTKKGKTGLVNGLIGIAAVAVCGVALGDDISGADRVLCASATVVLCVDSGTCESMSPAELNVPQFIHVDIKKRRLHSTEASGQNRSTKINKVTREDGFIYLQGIEGGRAFSFVINEATGMTTAAVARQDISVTVFGACTPTS